MFSGLYPSRSDTSSRLRNVEKKDTLHPPVSYRPISRTGTISRETSPGKTSPTNLSYNRLYPSSYSQTGGHERTDPANSSSTIPKYTARNSTSSSDSKTDLTSRYKSTGRTTSREDLSTGQKYITSRFLPKNTVEKSYTAYTRPSTVRTHETSRKNRELLNVIAAQHEQERTSRPVSRCSSVTPEDAANATKSDQSTTESIPSEEVETMESVSVVTRSTSPIQSNQPSLSRIRRVEVAKLVEKVITRPKKKKPMVDKEMQSDRLDDTSKYSRYGPNSTRAMPTPWSSFLDLKFSSPGNKQKSSKSECDETESVQSEKPDESSDTKMRKQSSESRSKEGSPKNISRTNSIKNLTRSLSKLDMKNRDSKSKTPPSPSALDKDKSKSKLSLSKTPPGSEKKLPPQIPKTNDNGKSGTLNSLNTLNKDFRKSVLNMSGEGKLKKQHSKRSNSLSSAESGSEAQLSEATDVSENLTTCSSFHKNSTFNSKLPQRIQTENNTRRSATRSPSSDSSSSSSIAASSSEDDTRTKAKPPENKSKKLQSGASSRTSVILSSADDLSTDKSPKPP